MMENISTQDFEYNQLVNGHFWELLTNVKEVANGTL
jgi:hypothetical protein